MKGTKGDRVVQVIIALTKSLCYLALFLGMQVLVMMPVILASALQAAVDGGVEESALYDLLTADGAAYTLISGLATILVVLAFYLIRREKLSQALCLRRVDAPILWTGAVLSPGLYLVVTLVLAALPDAWTQSYGDAASSIGTGSVIGVISVTLVAPVVEEIIFRGLIMTRLSRVMPGWLAVVLSAAVFGVCHGHPVWASYAFVLGVLYGFVALRAGSIWPSILGHVVFNAIGQVFTLLPETEDGIEVFIALGVLLIAGIVAPVVNRRGLAVLLKPVPRQEKKPFTAPMNYDNDPWDE